MKFFANSYTKSGIPDILACINGYFIGIEVKAQNGHPSALQLHHCSEIRKAGGFAYIVYPSGWENLKALLDDISIGDVIARADVPEGCDPIILK